MSHWGLALLLVLGPLLAGYACGKILRTAGGHRRRYILAALAPAISIAAIAWLPRVGAWDVVSVGLIFGAAFLLGGCRLDRRAAALALASSAIGLAGFEAATRRWLPPPTAFPPPAQARLLFEPRDYDSACSLLYSSEGPDAVLDRKRQGSPPPEKRGPLIVHLGDSMTYDFGVRAGEAFPSLLDASDPAAIHANYGVPGIGTDFEYLLLRQILSAHPSVARVVLHVYVGNDISDIDDPFECCDAGPLLDYAPSAPAARCPAERRRITILSRLGRSPAPYPLRVATSVSYAARRIVAVFPYLVRPLNSQPPHEEGEAPEIRWRHFARILTAMRDELQRRDIDFVVTLLPYRGALESEHPDNEPAGRARLRVLDIARRLGIRSLDSWELFARAVKRDGAGRYFLNPLLQGVPDIHFSPEGHRLLANWLKDRLSPLPTRKRAPQAKRMDYTLSDL